MTECNAQKWLFQELGYRKVEVDFGGGYLSSDGGSLILRELERHSGLLRDFSGCFIDYRDQRYVEHSVQELVSQRIHGLVLGYEDLNDHDHLRRDPVHGLICGKSDPLGQDRILERDKGKALAAHSTLNRLELGAQAIDARYQKIQPQLDEIQELLIKRGVKEIPRRSADSGFARDAIMTWCEENGVFYCLGLARNERLGERLKGNFESLKADIKEAKVEMPCRSFTEFEYSTLNSWTKARRVIGKAEILPKGDNPRFIVTNLPEDGWNDPIQAARFEAAALYEKFYCARGDMENRIKEQQMDLFADRTSTHWMASNQLRLWFSAFAHLIMSTLQATVLKGTELAVASIGQIRLRLFKIAARLTVSVRRIHIELCSAYPLQALFALVHRRLCALPIAA